MICPLKGHVKYVHNSALGHGEDAIYVNVFDVILIWLRGFEDKKEKIRRKKSSFSNFVYAVNQKFLLKGKFFLLPGWVENETLKQKFSLWMSHLFDTKLTDTHTCNKLLYFTANNLHPASTDIRKEATNKLERPCSIALDWHYVKLSSESEPKINITRRLTGVTFVEA